MEKATINGTNSLKIDVRGKFEQKNVKAPLYPRFFLYTVRSDQKHFLLKEKGDVQLLNYKNGSES